MTTRYHYDAKGNYRGRSLSDSERVLELAGIVIAVPVVLYFVLRWIWHALLGYATLAVPYKWFAGYYYFTIAVPYLWADRLSRWALKWTQWPNLNLVLAAVVFFTVLLLPYAIAYALLSRAPRGRRLMLFASLGPAVLMCGWYAASTVLGWLFAN